LGNLLVSVECGEVGGTFIEPNAQLDLALGLALQSPVVPNGGSDAMLNKTMPDLAGDSVETSLVETSKPIDVTSTALHFLCDIVQANTRMNENYSDIRRFASAGLW